MEQDQKMTIKNPAHGQPRAIDATQSLAGVIIGNHPTDPRRLIADSWSHGLSKRDAASVLHQLADQWDEDADLEDAQAAARERN
jgi:hypothetical protein